MTEKKQQLSARMSSYYKNNDAYHATILELTGERPSLEEKAFFEKIRDYHNVTDRPLNLLEIGCGACECAPALVSMLGIQEYYGVDASPFAIQSAHQKYPCYNLSVGDATQLSFEDNFFDRVISNFVLEHIIYPEKFIKEAIRVTRLGGLIGLIVPVFDLPWLVPSSLRHQRKNLGFLINFALIRWIELLRIRYEEDYYSFRLVEEPIVLLNQENYRFQPDDDLVYIATSLEVIKFFINSGCEVLSFQGRNIIPCIMNYRRPVISGLRQVAFNCLRLSLLKPQVLNYTTTASIVFRKTRI